MKTPHDRALERIEKKIISEEFFNESIDPVTEGLKSLIQIRENRDLKYGNAELKKGAVMLALFGGKIPDLKTESDLNRFGILNFIVSKLIRYCNNFEDGHDDSLNDISVYSQILKNLYGR